MHIARIAEEVAGAPEQFDSGAFHFLFGDFDDRVQVFIGLAQVRAFGSDVSVMECPERIAEFFHELKGDPHAFLRIFYTLCAVIPGAEHGAHAELVAAGAAEGMPVDHGEAQMLGHGFSFHELFGVIPLESPGVFGGWSLIRYLRDFREVFFRHGGGTFLFYGCHSFFK